MLVVACGPVVGGPPEGGAVALTITDGVLYKLYTKQLVHSIIFEFLYFLSLSNMPRIKSTPHHKSSLTMPWINMNNHKKRNDLARVALCMDNHLRERNTMLSWRLREMENICIQRTDHLQAVIDELTYQMETQRFQIRTLVRRLRNAEQFIEAMENIENLE